MAYNRLVVGGASLVMGLLASTGVRQEWISSLPDKCQEAILLNKSDFEISLYCPPGFDDGQLLLIIGAGLLAVVITFFGTEIFKFLWEKL